MVALSQLCKPNQQGNRVNWDITAAADDDDDESEKSTEPSPPEEESL